jgi:hypothetical protein
MRRSLPLPVLLAIALAIAAVQASPAWAVETVTLTGLIVRAEDGGALTGVTVEVRGSGVPAVRTDAHGRYRVQVPGGRYQLVASDRCLVGAARTLPAGTAWNGDFRLVTRTDPFGYGCRTVPWQWIDTTTTAGLAGREYNKLGLPFAFPYYGRRYSTVWVTKYGFLMFEEQGPYTRYPEGITPSKPNNAIYLRWSPHYVNVTNESVTYKALPDRMVISYKGLSGALSFQVHLWSDGRIDLVYSDYDDSGGAFTGLAGIESPDGLSAFSLGNYEALPPRTAWRIYRPTTATVAGSVINGVDGQPVAGATVKASPSGRSTVTDRSGRYELALIPGSYTISAVAPNYGARGREAHKVSGRVELAPLEMSAAAASIDTSPVDLVAEDRPHLVRVTNTGTRPLEYVVFTRDQGETWARAAGPPVPDHAFTPFGRDLVMTELTNDDPNDGWHATSEFMDQDIVGVDGGANGDTLRVRVRNTPLTQVEKMDTTIWLDTDQRTTTGFPWVGTTTTRPVAATARPRLGADYVIHVYGANSAWLARLARDGTEGDRKPIAFDASGSTTTVNVSLSALADPSTPATRETGSVDLAVGTSNFVRTPFDIAPERGRSRVIPERPADWLSASPAARTLAPGACATISVAADEPASQWAELRIETNDPRQPTVRIPVHARAPMPRP